MSNSINKPCPLCSEHAQASNGPHLDYVDFFCGNCGHLRMSPAVRRKLERSSGHVKSSISERARTMSADQMMHIIRPTPAELIANPSQGLATTIKQKPS